MALDSKVFTPGNPPDHSAALMQIAMNRPNIYKAFSQGYDDAQKRQIALQQYRQAKMKADLAEAMYPGILAEQQRALQARMNADKFTNQYASNVSTPPPIDQRRNATPAPGPGTTNSPVQSTDFMASGVNPKLRDPGFETGFDPNMQFAPAPSVGVGGSSMGITVPSQTTTGDVGDYGNYIASDSSPYEASDFLT